MANPDHPAGEDDELALEDYIDLLNGDFHLD